MSNASKFLALCAPFVLVLTGVSFWWNSGITEQLVDQSRRESVRGLVDSIVVAHHAALWQSEDGRVDDLIKGLTSRKYTWAFVQSAQAGSDASENSFESSVFRQFKTTDKAAAEALSTDATDFEFFERRKTVDGATWYQLYTPIRITSRRCTECHDKLDHAAAEIPLNQKIGELVSVLTISMPDDKTQIAVNAINAHVLTAITFTAFLTILGSYAIVRYAIVSSPANHRKSVTTGEHV